MASQSRPTPPASEKTSDPGDWSTVQFQMAEPQARQFLRLYRSLCDFDERLALSRLACPRLCFGGGDDEIRYDERWDNVQVSIGGRLQEHARELETAGWSVRLLDGLDHTSAMQARNVLPAIEPWLRTALSRGGRAVIAED